MSFSILELHDNTDPSILQDPSIILLQDPSSICSGTASSAPISSLDTFKMVADSAKMVKYFGGWSMLALASLLSSFLYIWFQKIEAIVPEPYLVSNNSEGIFVQANG
jgi:hypothetical protein